MPQQTTEECCDEQIAERVLGDSNQMPGLPAYLGIKLLRLAAGLISAEADLSTQAATPSGDVHGGVVAGILDNLTVAVTSRLVPDGHWRARTELKLNYVAPVARALLRTEASVLAITNRSTVVRAEAFRADRLVAAQGTIVIVAPRPVATGVSP